MRYNIKVQQPKPKPKKVGMIKKQPKLGDTKEKIRFALFPTEISKTEGVWLEQYIEIWEYKKFRKRVPKYHENIVSEDGRPYQIGEKIVEDIDWKIVQKKYIN